MTHWNWRAVISASGLDFGGHAAELDLRPGPHLVQGDEDQDGRGDDRPDHLEPLAAVEVLAPCGRVGPGLRCSMNLYAAETSTIWVPMNTTPVMIRR